MLETGTVGSDIDKRICVVAVHHADDMILGHHLSLGSVNEVISAIFFLLTIQSSFYSTEF